MNFSVYSSLRQLYSRYVRFTHLVSMRCCILQTIRLNLRNWYRHRHRPMGIQLNRHQRTTVQMGPPVDKGSQSVDIHDIGVRQSFSLLLFGILMRLSRQWKCSWTNRWSTMYRWGNINNAVLTMAIHGNDLDCHCVLKFRSMLFLSAYPALKANPHHPQMTYMYLYYRYE